MTYAGPLHSVNPANVSGAKATAPGRTEGGWAGQAFPAQPYQVSIALLLAQPPLQASVTSYPPLLLLLLLRSTLYFFPLYKLHMHINTQ